VQDEGSQLLADLAVAGLEGEKGVGRKAPLVVDLCAGAGGKTLAIAARLGNHGRIVATDIDDKKLEELRRRARRGRVSNAQAVHLEGGAWPAALDALRGKADVVLVDAPCSGIGSLRRNPEARWRLRESDLAGFAAKQREILANATNLLAPGGRLVYGTCTLLRSENADVVDALLADKPLLARVPLHGRPRRPRQATRRRYVHGRARHARHRRLLRRDPARLTRRPSRTGPRSNAHA